MSKDKQTLIKDIRELENKYNIQLLDENLYLTDFAIKILINTGLHYAIQGFELCYKIIERSNTGGNKNV